tara:strand:+ start:872 stop:1264 length:393 start_codon:yes stop_codon:yes gene_type:complete
MMAVLEKMGKKNGQLVVNAIMKMLPSILEPLGLIYELDDHRVNGLELRFHLTIKPESAGNIYEIALKEKLADMPNIDGDKVGKIMGREYKLVGYKKANRKYPWLVQLVGEELPSKTDTHFVNRVFARENI